MCYNIKKFSKFKKIIEKDPKWSLFIVSKNPFIVEYILAYKYQNTSFLKGEKSIDWIQLYFK